LDGIVRDKVNLSTFSVVLVLAGKVFAFETVKYLSDRLCRSSKHGLEWNSWLKVASFAQLEDAMLDDCWNDDLVARKLTARG